MVLEAEETYFAQQQARLLAEHPGKFALIKADSLVGTFDTAEAAYVEGVRRYGNTSFLVKQILPEEPIAHLPALSLGLLRVHP